ncbi:MAG: hypothetical protein J6582_02675, partial [Snodgrassella sp.]|uniref:hypothetical protein n=1 Tax=Snodgrassella sp. TaxID=2815304 RepID=UPI00258BD427
GLLAENNSSLCFENTAVTHNQQIQIQNIIASKQILKLNLITIFTRKSFSPYQYEHDRYY